MADAGVFARLGWSALALLLWSGCGGGAMPTGAVGPQVVRGPELAPAPNDTAPLAAILRVASDVPTRVELDLDDELAHRHVVADSKLARMHHVHVLGLAADTKTRVGVTLVDEHGARRKLEPALEVRTPPLPAGFPPLHVNVARRERMEPGFTFLNARGSGGPPDSPPSVAYLIALDEFGRVVWFYHHPKFDIVAATRTRDEHLLFLSGRKTAIEIDLLGNTLHTWFASRLGLDEEPEGATRVDLDTLHHEIFELPRGYGADFVALSTELHEVPDYPTSEGYPSIERRTANVIDDVVVEFNRDGTVVKRWPLFELLDPQRIGYDCLTEHFWDHTYGDKATVDWAHSNAISIDPQDGNFVVSCRDQDVVFEFDRASGKLRWLLGPPLDWRTPWCDQLLKPVGEPFEWNYHQHAPVMLANGNLLLFDNGNGRASPPMLQMSEPLRYSRAVEFHVDEAHQTVSQVWSYGSAAAPWYSFFLGGVAPLPQTGNVLVTDGGKKLSPSVARGLSRVFEVTRSGEIVFEVLVRDDQPFDTMSWNTYRSERFASFYESR